MATKKWRGGAASVAQVTTITFSSYTVGETYTITCNGKDVSYQAGASTLTDVINGLVAAIGATTELEFGEFTAANDSGLVLTGSTLGVPFTVTASATTGTATVTETTAATGPNHFDNADNWEGGSVPSAGDDLLFENNSISLLYALEDTTNYGNITVESTYTGEIGLPTANAAGYQEYRPRFLKLGDGSSAYAIAVGQGNGRQSSRLLFDGNDASITLTVYGTGNSLDEDYALVLKNTDSNSAVTVYAGSVKLDADSSGSFSSVNITPGSSFSNATLLATSTVSCGNVIVAGGTFDLRGSATSLDASAGAQATISNAATCPTLKAATGAVIRWNSTANITTKIYAYDAGTIDFSGNADAKSVTAAECFQNGTIRDPLGIVEWQSGIALSGTKVEDVNLDLGRDQTVSTTPIVAGQQLLDSENADRDLTSQVTILTHTPSATDNLICTAAIFLGDGAKDLDGTGGTFEIEITIGGASWLGGPQEITLGTQVRAVLQIEDFVVPAGDEVVVKLLSPNAADTDVDVTCFLTTED